MSFKGAVAGLLHYWFTPPKNNEYFPYYTTSQWPQADWDTHPYNIGAIGLLCVPFFYGMALAPRVCVQAKGWEQKTMHALLPLAPIMTSITIYCLGGVCARYLMGVWPLASLAALAILMRFLSAGQDSMVKKAISYPLVYGACLFSIVMVFCMAFNSFSGLSLGQGGFLSKLVYDAFTF